LILEEECTELNKRFYFHQKTLYYFKWAESQDGFNSPKENQKKTLLDYKSYSRQLVHKWRSEEQAILSGKQSLMTIN
jgi:diaminohydroxyphosphoribosylaminopyrimidine deaminase/5-amino-6-(5-phosphoribosylamino)uracil reductase